MDERKALIAMEVSTEPNRIVQGFSGAAREIDSDENAGRERESLAVGRHDQNRTRRDANQTFTDASQKHVCQACMTVSTDDDERCTESAGDLRKDTRSGAVDDLGRHGDSRVVCEAGPDSQL